MISTPLAEIEVSGSSNPGELLKDDNERMDISEIMSPLTGTTINSPLERCENIDIDEINSTTNDNDNAPDFCIEFCKKNKENKFPSGRFICDLNLVIEQARAVEAHTYECSFGGKLIFKEMKTSGLVCTLHFVCDNPLCPVTETISTDSNGESLNELAVLGALSTGSGFSQEEEKFSTMDVKYMSRYMFSSHEKKAGEVVQACAKDNMEKNIMEEIKAAERRGDKDDEGYNITAIVDGGWCKRSYGRGYNASSGVAVIMGLATKKIIFLGIRNKFCVICQGIKKGKIAEKKHTCYKNWEGSSTGMESDVIVEGLNYLNEVNNVKCSRIVGDGDSNTMTKIKQKVPYGRSVLKIECVNHAVRRFRRALERLHLSCKRKMLKEKIPLLVNTSRSIIKFYSVQPHIEPTKELIKEFIDELHNIPDHISGKHSNCGNYCKSKNSEIVKHDEEKTFFPPDLTELIIGEMNKTLISCANTIIFNVTNNLAENFMSQLCKTSGGKRVDFSRAGGINRRAHIALLSHQTPAQGWIKQAHSTITGSSPRTPLRTFVARRQKMYMRRKLFPAKKIKKPSEVPAGGDHSYGDFSQKPDMAQSIFDELSHKFLQNLQVQNSSDLEEITRGQHLSERWRTERSKRISSSFFKDVADRRITTSCVNLVNRIIYKSFTQTESMRYGLANEIIAGKQYETETGNTIIQCGLFIDLNNPFLCTSPDGLVGDNGLIEIKCPYSARSASNLEEVSKVHNIGLRYKSDGEAFLPTNHRYFYQIQGQLAITGRKWCDLYFWCPNDTVIIRIAKDEAFWGKILPKLKSFYLDCILPEIIDPRANRSLPLRDPYIKKMTH